MSANPMRCPAPLRSATGHRLIRRRLSACLCAYAWLAGLPIGAHANETPQQRATETSHHQWNHSIPLVRAPSPPTWRDRITPFDDPLRTEPPVLHAPLQVSLPVELSAPDRARGDATPTQLQSHQDTISCPDPQTLDRRRSSVQPPQVDTDPDTQALPTLTLAQAIHRALCAHPDIRASWSQIAQHAAALGEVRSQYLPHAQATFDRQRDVLNVPQFGRLPSANKTDADRQSVGLDWRLWDFGGRHARIDAAKAQLQAAMASQNAAVLQAFADILARYNEAQITQAHWQAQRRLLPLFQRIAQSLDHRLRAGLANTNDALQTQAALARAELAWNRAHGDYEIALGALNRAIGADPLAEYQLDPPALPDNHDASHPDPLLAITVPQWLTLVHTKHPSLRAAHTHWRAAQANIQAAQADGLPTLTANYNVYRNGRPSQSLSQTTSHEWLVGITLTIPLFEGFATTYKVRGAQAAAEQQAIAYETTQHQLEQETAQHVAQAHAAWRNLAAADRLLKITTRCAQSLQHQLHHGMTDLPTLNHALIDLLQAQQEEAQVHADWLRARMTLLMLDATLPTLATVTD